MRISVFLATVVLVMAAIGGSARADPRIIVFNSDYRPVAPTTVDAYFVQQKIDRPPGKIQMWLQGGTIDVTKTPGTAIGNAVLVASASPSTSTGGTVRFVGSILVANPADHVVDGAACTGIGLHDAVWVLQLTGGGRSWPLTVYIDRNTGTLRADGRWAITICPPSPFVSEDQGGSPLGATVQQLALHLTNVYRNGGTAGVYHWWVFVTPYLDGTANLDPRGEVETRALTPIPYLLGLERVHGPSGSVRLAGSLEAFYFRFAGVRLDVYAGANKQRLRLVGRTSAVTKTGVFTFTRRIPLRATYFQAIFGPIDVTHVPGDYFCGGPSEAPGGCVTATLSEIDSNIVKVSGRR